MLRTFSYRPVNFLKSSFLILAKEVEQQLTSQFSTSNSPTPTSNTKTKSSTKPMSKKTDTKAQEKSTAIIEQSSSTVRSVEVQTNDNSLTRTTTTTTTGVTIADHTYQYVGVIPIPNASLYVHFINVSYSAQQFFRDNLPETFIMQDEFININDYHQSSASMQSMPNIALTQDNNKKRNVFTY